METGSRAFGLEGRRFGRLTVLERAGTDKHRHALWRVRCDCGVEFTASGTNLLRGKTRSCGCIRVERLKENAMMNGRKGNGSGR